MNRIKKFIDNDILLTPGAYEKVKNVDEGKLNKLLESEDLFLKDFPVGDENETDETKDKLGDESEEVGKEEIEGVSQSESEGEDVTKDFERTLKLIKKPEDVEGKYRISEFVDYYNKRFSKLKKILQNKMDSKDLISINKLSSYGTEGIILGIVRKIEDDYALVEDNTSSVKVETGENLVEDEVIGIKGKKNKDKFVADKVYYPDLSFKREINTLDEEKKALFLSNINSDKRERIGEILDEEGIDYIFITGNDNFEDCENFLEGQELEGILIAENEEIGDENIGMMSVLGSPTWSEISNKITILQYRMNNYEDYKKKLDVDSSRDVTLKLLKKRHLDPSGQNFFRDEFLLDDLPDMIHCGNLSDFSVYNYKGTTVINTTGEKGVIVNLSDREIEEIEL